MDIEVKSMIDKLLLSCRQIDSYTKRKTISLESLVVADMHSFIKKISVENAKERITYFDQVYLSDCDIQPTDEKSIPCEFPAALKEFCRVDEQVLKSRDIGISNVYLCAFVAIGKSYLFNRNDKKDIDAVAFNTIVGSMRKYIDDYSSKSESEPTSSGKKVKQEDTTNLAKANEESATAINDSDNEPSIEQPERSLEELLGQLNSLIGLSGVKNEVNTLVNLLKIKKLRESRGFKSADVSMHLVFLGNPGTGKTTVARLLSKIYRQLGVLEKGQLVEVDRAGLVAGYVGQTALKTKEKIDEAMGGILFIDEAYTLAKGDNDFGQEAIDTILKAMEDNRDKFIVIVAGYPEPMESFLESNPGLKSRFNKSIMFEDYSEEELLAIFELSCNKYGMYLKDDAKEALSKYLHSLCANKPENFANGREMRNLFERAYSNQANRLAAQNKITDDELNEISVEDLFINGNLQVQ